MKTENDIREEYIKKLIKFAQEQEDKRKFKDGKPIDRTNDIYVTDICAWDTYCPKQIYYNKVAKRPPAPEALIRFTIGHVAHEIPLWDDPDPVKNGHEEAFQWNGLRCRMDEINFDDGIIVDKKTVAALSIKPKDYVTKQLNIYRVIAEENEQRPTKINQLFVLNMVTLNGKIQVLEVPMWDKAETIKYIESVSSDIKEAVQTRTPPKVECGSKGWICESCQYKDLCRANARCESQPQPDVLPPQEAKEEEKAVVKIKTGKRKK